MNDISVCAACGKSSDNLKACTACRLVKYCNRDCQIADRPKHKKECRRRAAEIRTGNTDEKMKSNKKECTDDKLFADPPAKEDCPICMIPMPITERVNGVGTTYMACCGKLLCSGCVFAAQKEMNRGNMKELCEFCRVPLPDADFDKELMKRYKKRMDLNDAEAFYELACQYQNGALGLAQDSNKELELMNRSAELGSLKAHYSIAQAYYHGKIVKRDMNKTIHHWKLAAIGGHEAARHNLGVITYNSRTMDSAMKHFMIAARCGYSRSLKKIGEGYKRGYVTKDEYANTLRAYQQSCDEVKSVQRTKAAEAYGWQID